jgi:hypothetical protein
LGRGTIGDATLFFHPLLRPHLSSPHLLRETIAAPFEILMCGMMERWNKSGEDSDEWETTRRYPRIKKGRRCQRPFRIHKQQLGLLVHHVLYEAGNNSQSQTANAATSNAVEVKAV